MDIDVQEVQDVQDLQEVQEVEDVQETPEIQGVQEPKPGRGASERALRAAIELFTLWENDEKNIPLDRIVSAQFRSRKYLNSSERRWVAEAVYGCARLWRRQVYVLNARGQEASSENVIRLWAEENRLGEGKDTESPEELNTILPSPAQPHEYLRITLSFPDEMAASLENLLGSEALDAAKAFNTQAPTTLRVNPLRVSWAHLRKSLPDPTPTTYSPWGLELSRRVNIYELPGFRTGWFEVQEEASQLVALLVDAHPDDAIAEVGAGAGGKTLALAAMMENRGEILAIDTSQNRLDELQKRAERDGVTCVEMCPVGVDPAGEWQTTVSMRRKMNRWRGAADKVLVDAPCTGSGVIRRSPDAKWREFDLAQMTQLQATLLMQAATLVRPGGMLFYVTCAFEQNQNEDIVNAFLATELGQQYEVTPAVPRLIAACERADALAKLPPFLRTEKAQKKLAERQATEGGSEGTEPARSPADYDALASGQFLRTWPHRHGLDAFFAACLRHKEV